MTTPKNSNRKDTDREDQGLSLERRTQRDKEQARKWSGSKPDRGADQNRVNPSD